jgi:hypothetical protein
MTRKKGTGMVYRIVVRGELSERSAADYFEGMEIETGGGQTILTGEVIDDAHLHGILDRINSLGLTLVRLHALAEDAHVS